VVAALKHAYNGNLGGLSGANALCMAQAKENGYPGVWKAFLSTSTQNVKDLVTGADASNPVVNLNGQQLFSSWTSIFPSTYWASSYYLYSFEGVPVLSGRVSPNWTDGDGWTGTLQSGTVSNYTCNEWTSSSSSVTGTNGEWDSRYLLKQEVQACSNTFAVMCVHVP
jgi:hypothetical protein